MKKSLRGFTLTEALIVVAILAVLAAIVIPNVVGLMSRSSENSECLENWTAWSPNCGKVEIDRSRTKCCPDGLIQVYLIVHGGVPSGGNCTIYIVDGSKQEGMQQRGVEQ